MSDIELSPFNYSFIPGVAQYSAGVQAAPGYEIVRVRFSDTPEVADAFARVEAHLTDEGLDPSAVCSFELRSPGQFTEATFREFNSQYIGTLERWGLLVGGKNPVARSNVIPEFSTISAPSVHAFSYVVPNADAANSFIIAGSAEVPEGLGNYHDHIVALNDDSSEGLDRKTTWVLGEMARRLAFFGADWTDVTAAQVYTTRAYNDAHVTLAASVRTSADIAWQYCNPPVEGLEFEMDCRRVNAERTIGG